MGVSLHCALQHPRSCYSLSAARPPASSVRGSASAQSPFAFAFCLLPWRPFCSAGDDSSQERQRDRDRDTQRHTDTHVHAHTRSRGEGHSFIHTTPDKVGRGRSLTLVSILPSTITTTTTTTTTKATTKATTGPHLSDLRDPAPTTRLLHLFSLPPGLPHFRALLPACQVQALASTTSSSARRTGSRFCGTNYSVAIHCQLRYTPFPSDTRLKTISGLL